MKPASIKQRPSAVTAHIIYANQFINSIHLPPPPSPSLVLDLCPVITDSPCFPFPLHSPSLPQLQMIMFWGFFPPSWVINSHGNTFVTAGRLRWSAQWRFGTTEWNKWGRLLHLSVCKYMRVYRQRAWQGRWCILNCFFYSSLLTNVLFLLFCLKPRPLSPHPIVKSLFFLMFSATLKKKTAQTF